MVVLRVTQSTQVWRLPQCESKQQTPVLVLACLSFTHFIPIGQIWRLGMRMFKLQPAGTPGATSKGLEPSVGQRPAPSSLLPALLPGVIPLVMLELAATQVPLLEVILQVCSLVQHLYWGRRALAMKSTGQQVVPLAQQTC